MTAGGPGIERLHGSPGDLSWDRTTPGSWESFCPGVMERLQGSHSWDPGILSWETTPGESFCSQGESVLGWNDSRGVIPSSKDRTTPRESFRPGPGESPGKSFCPESFSPGIE